MIESGKLITCLGSSRSGKTKYVYGQIAGRDRVLVWDIKGKYPVDHWAYTRHQLIDLLSRFAGKPARIGYKPGDVADFDLFCRVAQAWVKSQEAAGARSTLVFEETSDVTSAAKAPPAYGMILRAYLERGVDIFTVSQRSAESDKTSIGNASEVHLCRLNLEPDRKNAARNTGVPLKKISALVADQDAGKFEYFHINTGRQSYHSGVLTYKGDTPVFTKTSEELPL